MTRLFVRGSQRSRPPLIAPYDPMWWRRLLALSVWSVRLSSHPTSEIPPYLCSTRLRIMAIQKGNEVAQVPRPIRESRFHCRSHPEGLMDLEEVVVGEVQRDGGSVHLGLLGESVGQPGDTSK